MDNLGDWLYIVFIIIAAVSGLIGSDKKKKQRMEPSGQPERGRNPAPHQEQEKGFWELLEEMQQETSKPTPAPKPAHSQTARPLDKSPFQKKSSPKAAPTPFLNAENNASPTLLTQGMEMGEEVEFSPLSNISFSDPDDLKKAVIYSEILNRKY